MYLTTYQNPGNIESNRFHSVVYEIKKKTENNTLVNLLFPFELL